MARLSSVEILGGGPAGLYAAILIRRRMPNVKLRVTEQNPAGATFGFGVVFSDQALDFLKASDPAIYDLVTPQMERWRNMTLTLPQGSVTLDGVGFSAIGRLELIEILRMEAEALKIDIRFSHQVTDLDELDADIVIGADGLNSLVRSAAEESFQAKTDQFTNHFAWFGTNRAFDTLTQTFIQTDLGPFNAHHYRFSPSRSTFIVECDDKTFHRYGFANKPEDESAAICSALFSETLQGASLITNKSLWRQFPRLWCGNWVKGRHVLLGDSAHTAHFSIGSGTRLALEDAIALVDKLSTIADVDEALSAFQAERPPIAKKIVDAANTSASWYENFAEKMTRPPLDFAFDYLSRSGRMDMDRLRKIAPDFMARYESAKSAGMPDISDPVGDSTKGAIEIGFKKADHPNCSAVLWDNLVRNPDKLAVIGPAGFVTYAELIRQAAKWGNAFLAAGIRRGERIAFFLDDTPAFPAAFFGAVRAGCVPVLINIQTKPDVLNYFLQDSGARFAICDAIFASDFDSAVFDGTNMHKTVVVNGPVQLDNQISADDFLSHQPETLDCAETNPDDMAFWMYSSGSTGRPKGIVHLHHDMAYSEAAFGRQLLKLQPDDIGFSVPKAYFAYGFGNSLLFPFSVGATSVLLPGQPRPEAVLDTIEKYRPTVIFGLPTLYTALIHSPGIENRDLSSLRSSMSAAEVLSQDVYSAWQRLTGHGPTEGLGSTEMLHIYLSNRTDDHRIGSAGARVPGYEIRLETPDGRPAGVGEEGVMFVRGHSSAPCYWNKPDKTIESMRGDWIYTGDRFIERDGYYYFQGRADDLIKVSGQWVWPLEVERCLNEHPDVQECAVMAHKLPDQRMTLRAVVRLRSGADGDEARSRMLSDYVKSQLQPHKYPRIIEYVEELPKTGTGKIDRQALLVPADAS
jgi:benzoate-CoA ligase family protein